MNLNYVTIFAHFRFVREKKKSSSLNVLSLFRKIKNKKDKENDSNKIVEINKIFQMSY